MGPARNDEDGVESVRFGMVDLLAVCVRMDDGPMPECIGMFEAAISRLEPCVGRARPKELLVVPASPLWPNPRVFSSNEP